MYRARVIGVALVTVFNVLDLVLTYYAISLGAVEGNPMAVWLIETHWGIALKLGVCATLIAGCVWRKRTDVKTLCLTYAVVGIYFLVVVLNVSTILAKRYG